MLKALLKKQLSETLSFFLLSGKKGKRRSPLAAIGLLALILYVLVAVVVGMWMLSDAFCGIFLQEGLSWAYFALFGGFAAAFACIGSVFAVKNRLYEAKDNDLLLSMPVKPWQILLSRLFSLYLLSLLIVAVVFVPAVVRYFTLAGVQVLPLLFCVGITFVLPLGALAVCCLLGWLIALVTSKLPAKNLFTVLLFLLFFVFYFYVYSQMNKIIEYVLTNSEQVSALLQKIYPFWQMGLAATGNVAGLLLFIAMFGGAFAVVYLLLSKTFLYLITTKRGEQKKKYVEKTRKPRSAFWTLVSKESARYLKSPMIALNCMLGTLLLLAFPVVALFNRELCQQLAAIPEKGEIVVIMAILLCFMASSNIVTGSSVSLEGEGIWQVKAMPVSAWTVLSAKNTFHLLATLPPAFVSTVCLSVLLKVSFPLAALTLFVVCAMICFCAFLGQAINLNMPNLHWTNEVVAVKQSVSTLVAMFAGWGASALLIGGYFLFGKYLPAEVYLALCGVVLALASAGIVYWLKKYGTQIFSEL